MVNNKVIQIWGFCGFATCMQSDFRVPQNRKGTLTVIGDFKSGVGSYRINAKDSPVYLNSRTGWVCVGNPQISGHAVEFINNCVAVINNIGDFVALWLKPQFINE